MKYVTGKVRASFVNLEEPNTMSGKYQLDLLIPKGSEEEKKINKVIEDTIADGVERTKKWNGKRPAKLTLPLKDGDEKLENAEKPELYEVYKGMSYITPKASKPNEFFVFDKHKNRIEVDEIYPGCYVRVSLDFFPYAHDLGGRGVSVKLVGIQFAGDGESLGGGHRSEADVADDFGEIADDLDDF